MGQVDVWRRIARTARDWQGRDNSHGTELKQPHVTGVLKAEIGLARRRGHTGTGTTVLLECVE
jgi:hypothetical protein